VNLLLGVGRAPPCLGTKCLSENTVILNNTVWKHNNLYPERQSEAGSEGVVLAYAFKIISAQPFS